MLPAADGSPRCFQSKKLTEQAKLLKEQANAQQEQMLFRINAERDEAADKISTLKEANDTLRHELGSMMGSIPRFIDTRTREVADEKDFRATIRAEAREELSVRPPLRDAPGASGRPDASAPCRSR